MKNTITISRKALWAFIFGFALIVGSCTKSNDLVEQKDNGDPLLKSAAIPVVNTSLYDDGCNIETICFVAGQNFDAGTVYVSQYGQDQLRISIKTNDPWILQKVHMYVGPGPIPVNNAGNPAPGNFPIITNNFDDNTLVSYVFNKSDLMLNANDELLIAIHAEVYNPVTGKGETAWACGTKFNKSGWATYFTYKWDFTCQVPTKDCTGETAFGGNTTNGSKPWFYYFVVSDGSPQSIYAGQNYVSGASVSYENGAITVTLGPNMELNMGAETIKIKGYSEEPTERESAGLFPYKNTDGSLTVAVGEFPFYVIHLDVKVCWP